MQTKWRQYWFFQLIGWGSFCFINIFFAFSFNKLNPDFFNRLLIFLLLGVIFSHLMREIITRLGILRKSLNKQALQFLILTFSLAFLVSYITVESFIGFKLLRPEEQQLLSRPHINYLVSKLLLVLSSAFSYFILFFIWNLIYFVYHYVTKSRRQQLDTLQLESLVKELELKTIKAHINPHFIFNSLNSIRALVVENPSRARTAITELSNILRSSMNTEKVESLPFEKELDIVKDYLALENMRFEERLNVEYEIDEDTLEQSVPPMMLQTLVENAIKHGISRQISGGMVKIMSTFKDGEYEMTVQNTGYLNGLMNNGTQPDDWSGWGFGLSSTVNRLHLLYGDKARFEIKQITQTIVSAKVVLPVNGI